MLNDLLAARGQTLYWLAQQTGIRYATIWKLSRGEVGRLGIDALDRICAALECQPGDLLVREMKAARRKRGK
jgi:putative transcriptional regulator